MNIKKKIYFLILIISALFCLVNCSKDKDSQGRENNSNESTFKELEKLKKPIDFTSLTFNEAQQKLIDIYIADFPKDIEAIEWKKSGDETLDRVAKRYYYKAKDGKESGGSFKEIYFKKGTKESFTGKIIYKDFYTSSHIEEYIKDGEEVLGISYGNGEKYSGSENSLKLLDSLDVCDNKQNQISYDFQSDFINEKYAKENGITLDDYGRCLILVITERMNGILIKHIYYYYDFNTGKPVTKYEETFPENLEFAKTSKIIYYEEK